MNGPFGIGKTTVARLLRNSIRRAGIADPERIGYLLQRAPRRLTLEGRDTGDFQDMPMWRTLAAEHIAFVHLFYPYVIVPMAFRNPAYLHEILRRVQRTDREQRVFSLTAPWPVVEARLRASGTDPTTAAGAWRFRDAQECLAAQADPLLGAPLDATGTPEEIVREIRIRMTQ